MIVIIYCTCLLGQSAFYQCSVLSSVTLISGLTVIGNYAFDMGNGPTKLTTVTIPSTVTLIGENK